MQWGKDLQFLLDLYEETGKMPRALETRVELPEHLDFFWDAFWECSTDRKLGFGALGEIPFSALDRYANRFGVVGPAFDRFRYLLRRMDTAYLAEVNKKPATSKRT